MPYFHKSFYQNFGCKNKYLDSVDNIGNLHCPKQEMTLIWETNVGIPIEDQVEKFSCINKRCCISMISFVKGKFNFLAAFCIVGVIFMFVAIMNAYYMNKKLRKYKTDILRHQRDNILLIFMVGITLLLGSLTYFKVPAHPQGFPKVLSQNKVS
jgi:hypothetical protein